MADSLTPVTTALAHWKKIDAELLRVEKLAQAAVTAGATPEAVHEWTILVADLRSQREKTYRVALVAMRLYYDQSRE